MPYLKVVYWGICHFLKLNILDCDTGGCATFVTFAVCLGYIYKIVKVTEQFKSVVVAATLAIATYYIILVFYVY
jgi:uncharacterized YccA/Bax inhibitor family protein